MTYTKIFIFLYTLTVLLMNSADATPRELTLDGHYQMDLTIRDKVFKDEMVLKGAKGTINYLYYIGDITGSITVPGVFTSVIEKGTAYNTGRGQLVSLDFKITASENGSQFQVHYKGRVKREDHSVILNGKMPITLYGEAYLDNNELLGTFKAVKNE